MLITKGELYLMNRMNSTPTNPWPNDVDSVASLVRLRWIAVASQFVVVGCVRFFLDARLPILPILVVIGVVGLSNIAAAVFGTESSNPRYWYAVISILDVVLLTALLALSGGASNPFSVLYTVHVILTAMLARPLLTAAIAALSVVGFGLLFFVNVPLPPELGGHLHCQGAFSAHLQGMWLAFAATAITSAFFVTRLSTTLRRVRDEHHRTVRLLGLATLAAGAAHEIGNPLGTIKIAASEMRSAINDGATANELLPDCQLILSEVDRTQQAIQRLALGAGELMGEAPTSIILEDVVSLLQVQFTKSVAIIQFVCEEPKLSVRWPTHAVLQAVDQVLRNAVQASPAQGVVTCHIRRTEGKVCFEIRDLGAGIPIEIQDRLGEPFFTTREVGQGIGLGLFIARSLVQHLGGALDIESKPGTGTRVAIHLPLGAPT